MNADDHRGALRTPILADDEASGSNRVLEAQEARKAGHSSNKALKLILALQFLEVTAFYGIYLSLIVYLQEVFHGHSASNVACVNYWVGVSYHMPVLGAAIADSFWGKYKTVMIGLSVSVVGMAMVTASAALPSLSPPPCVQNAICAPATLSQKLVFFSGLYLCGVGIGASKAVVISFAAEQYDDEDDGAGKKGPGRGAKASYFSWYYAVANMGMMTAGTLLVWVEAKVNWGLGYGICTSFVAVAVVILAATAPMYRISPPAGSPWKGVFQVLYAFSRKVKLKVPDDATALYEGEEDAKDPLVRPLHERLQHSDQFRFLDKAAIITDEDLNEDGDRPWRLCPMTQVEELKTLLKLIPIWLTSAVYFVANTQAQTTFVQQGTRTDTRIPAPSLTAVETALVAACVALYNRTSRRLTPLRLMGLGHATAAVAVGVAAWAESRRLRMAGDHERMGIAWLLPQYVVMAISDASLSVGQLEFFYDQSPETMKGASTAFYFVSVSIGNLINSQLVTLIASVTAAGGRTGWFPPEMDDGHLDYYFVLVVVVTVVNFAVFVALAKNYTPKRVR
ncbi:protein NRT1/ PTR FAMILY 8.5 isoform X1 [Lolium perenne]|uniref:protein NRT1/ PTR FAMILY 8.5 isoform X1 n=2 Tax=Lolium perenne TaxID=4522 RepID=UPI0021F674D5|nr:protein NRT1/ PTR FAMILY 8.5-like isoform X1 [Lolium perenne]